MSFPLPIAAPQAAPIGEIGLSAGYVWPQGVFTEFADPGPTFHLRSTFHLPAAPSLIGRADASSTEFKQNRTSVDIRVPGYIGPAERVTAEEAWVLHARPQLGSPTSKGFFRPRAGLGVGFYLFRRSDHYNYIDNFGYNACYPGSNNLYLGRFGWRGNVGADFFLMPKWGISGDLIYDHVWSANSTSPARYQGFTVGLVIPLEVF